MLTNAFAGCSVMFDRIPVDGRGMPALKNMRLVSVTKRELLAALVAFDSDGPAGWRGEQTIWLPPNILRARGVKDLERRWT